MHWRVILRPYGRYALLFLFKKPNQQTAFKIWIGRSNKRGVSRGLCERILTHHTFVSFPIFTFNNSINI